MKPSASAILWPIAPPLIILLVTWAYLAIGGDLYAHGASMNFMFLTLIWSFGAAIWEVCAVPVAIWHLRANPDTRTIQNVTAVLAGSAYLGGALIAGLLLPK